MLASRNLLPAGWSGRSRTCPAVDEDLGIGGRIVLNQVFLLGPIETLIDVTAAMSRRDECGHPL
jgi:hypothetical protein